MKSLVVLILASVALASFDIPRSRLQLVPAYRGSPDYRGSPGYPGYPSYPGFPSSPGSPSYPGLNGEPGRPGPLKKTSLLFDSDTHFIYKYKAHALTGIKTLTGTKTGIRLECEVVVKKQTVFGYEGISVWIKNLELYKLYNVKVVRPDLPLSDIHTGRLINIDVDTERPIHITDLDKVLREVTEKDFSLNLKKSVATLLKVSPEALEKTTTTLTECGILGTCSVLYNTQKLRPDTLNVTKIYNTKQCTSRPVVEARRPQMWWDDEELYNTTSEPLTGSLSVHTRYGLIKVNTDNEVPWTVDWVRAVSTHDAAPISEKEPRLATFVVQEMKLMPKRIVDVKPIVEVVTDVFGLHMTLAPLRWIQETLDSASTLPHMSRPSLQRTYDIIRRNLRKFRPRSVYEAESETICRSEKIKEIIATVSQKFETKNVMETDDTVEYVPLLKQKLMWCSKEEIKTLFDFYYQTKETYPVRFSMMTSSMSKLWTIEALEVMQEAMHSNKFTKFEMINMFTGINTHLYSNKDFVKKIQIICDMNVVREKPLVFHTCLLALGSHLYKTYAQQNTKLDLPILPRRGRIHESVELIRVVEWLKVELRTQGKTDLERAAVVKAMGNSGLPYFWTDLYHIITQRRTIERIAPVEQSVPMYSDVLRVTCMQALHNMIRLPLVRIVSDNKNIVDDIKATLFTVITVPTETATLRMEALRVLMEARPTVLELRLITEQLRTEPDMHFASGAYSYLQQLADTELPSYTVRAQKLRDALRSIPKPVVRPTEWSRVFDYIDKFNKNGMLFKVFTMDESFTIPIPRNLMLSLQTFFSGKTFNHWDFGTWMTSWTDLVKDIKTLLKNERILEETEQNTLLLEKLQYTLRLAATVEGGFYIKIEDQDVVFVTFKDIRRLFQEQTFSREPRPMFNWFRMFSAPMLHETVPTMIGVPLYSNRTTDVLLQTKIDGQVKLFTEMDVTLDIKLKHQCTTRMGMQLPGMEVGTKYTTRNNLDLPMFLKLKNLDDSEYTFKLGFLPQQQTEERLVITTECKAKHFYLTTLDRERTQEIRPESAFEEETKPEVNMKAFGFMLKYNKIYMSSPFLGFWGKTSVTVVPTRPNVDELFTLKVKIDQIKNRQNGDLFFTKRVPDNLRSIMPRVDVEHSLMNEDMNVGRVPVTNYKLQVKLITDDTWKVLVEGYRTKDVVKMRFMTDIIYMPGNTGEEEKKLCIRWLLNTPQLASVVDVERSTVFEPSLDMKFAVVAVWGENCERVNSEEKFLYFQMVGKTAHSIQSDIRHHLYDRIVEMKRRCEVSMKECPKCTISHDHCLRYRSIMNQIIDIDLKVDAGDLLPQWFQEGVIARYWFLRSQHPTVYTSTKLEEKQNFISARLNLIPTFAQPNVITTQVQYNEISETFRELSVESLLRVMQPLFVYPETYISVNLINALFPLFTSTIVPTVQQFKGECKVQQKSLVTFDKLRFELDTPLFSSCPVVLAADCSGDEKFLIAKDGRHVKILLEEKSLKYNIITRDISRDDNLLDTKVFKVSTDDKTVLRIPKLGIEVVVENEGQTIKVLMPRFYEQRVCGVCGHFDGNSLNDLMAPDTSVYPVDVTPEELKHLVYHYTLDKETCLREPTITRRPRINKDCNMELIDVHNVRHIKQHRGRHCVPFERRQLRCPTDCQVERSVRLPVNYLCNDQTHITQFFTNPHRFVPNGIFSEEVPLRCTKQ